jgi:hypothetical protein
MAGKIGAPFGNKNAAGRRNGLGRTIAIGATGGAMGFSLGPVVGRKYEEAKERVKNKRK